MPTAQAVRRATEADLPAIEEIITAAYSVYLTRMDRPPAPMLRDSSLASLMTTPPPGTEPVG